MNAQDNEAESLKAQLEQRRRPLLYPATKREERDGDFFGDNGGLPTEDQVQYEMDYKGDEP